MKPGLSPLTPRRKKGEVVVFRELTLFIHPPKRLSPRSRANRNGKRGNHSVVVLEAQRRRNRFRLRRWVTTFSPIGATLHTGV